MSCFNCSNLSTILGNLWQKKNVCRSARKLLLLLLFVAAAAAGFFLFGFCQLLWWNWQTICWINRFLCTRACTKAHMLKHTHRTICCGSRFIVPLKYKTEFCGSCTFRLGAVPFHIKKISIYLYIQCIVYVKLPSIFRMMNVINFVRVFCWLMRTL